MPGNKITFIAEIGINHHGSFSKALRMVQLAKEAGAHIAKFQYYIPLDILGKDSPYLGYANQCFFTKEQHEMLAFHCMLVGIEYMVSVFDQADIPWADKLCKRHKIATRMNNNALFIHDLLFTQKPVIMSIQSHLQEIDHPKLSYMWCVAKYPSDKAQLAVYPYDTTHGLSSHCPDWTASLNAALQGATIIENHVCESKEEEEGCDIPASLDFETYGKLIRECNA